MSLPILLHPFYLHRQVLSFTTKSHHLPHKFHNNFVFIFQSLATFQEYQSHLQNNTPDVISATSHKCITHFEVTWHKFPCKGNRGFGANQHGNMLCFGGNPTLISIGQKLHAMKHEPWNKNLETYHPLKHVKFQWVAWCAFWCPSSSSPQNISHWNM